MTMMLILLIPSTNASIGRMLSAKMELLGLFKRLIWISGCRRSCPHNPKVRQSRVSPSMNDSLTKWKWLDWIPICAHKKTCRMFHTVLTTKLQQQKEIRCVQRSNQCNHLLIGLGAMAKNCQYPQASRTNHPVLRRTAVMTILTSGNQRYWRNFLTLW